MLHSFGNIDIYVYCSRKLQILMLFKSHIEGSYLESQSTYVRSCNKLLNDARQGVRIQALIPNELFSYSVLQYFVVSW